VASGFVTGAFAYFVIGVDIPGGTSWPLKDICLIRQLSCQTGFKKAVTFCTALTLCFQLHSGISPMEETRARWFCLDIPQYTVPGRDILWIGLCNCEVKMKQFLHNSRHFHYVPILKTLISAVLFHNGGGLHQPDLLSWLKRLARCVRQKPRPLCGGQMLSPSALGMVFPCKWVLHRGVIPGKA